MPQVYGAMQKRVASTVITFRQGGHAPEKASLPKQKGKERCHKPPSNPRIRLSDWRPGAILGRGRFGFVVQARHVHTRKLVAWKRYKTPQHSSAVERGSRMLGLLEREISIHQSLDHPNILPFLGHVVNVEYVTLILEYADKGDLFDYSNRFCVTGLDRARLFHQVYAGVVSAVAYLERLQIAHRDIKPENILLKSHHGVSNPVTVIPQLCDFGWSKFYLKSGKSTTLCGTPEYLPPEMLSSSRRWLQYDAEFVDPWALGTLALELLRGETPFQAEDRSSVFTKILAFRGSLGSCVRVALHSTLAAALSHQIIGPTERTYVTMVEAFLQSSPSERMTATECLERYADLLGPLGGFTSSPQPPSVKQRRQVFQSHFSGRVTSSPLFFP